MIAKILILLLLVGCTSRPVQLRQFEYSLNDCRMLYTVDMFKSGEERLNGYWVSFHPESDVKQTEGSHVNGRMHGVWTWWNPSGELQAQKRYERGRVVEEKNSPPWWNYP